MDPKIFAATGYGQCKIEIYTKKGYIRQVLGKGKFKSIINCDKGKFDRVLKDLVAHVAEGKSKDELVLIRDALVEKYDK